MKRLAFILSIFLTCTGGPVIASSLEELIEYCISKDSIPSAAQREFQRQGLIDPSDEQLDSLAKAMSSRTSTKDHSLSQNAMAEEFTNDVEDAREHIRMIQNADEYELTKEEDIQVFASSSDGIVVNMSWSLKSFVGYDRDVRAFCTIFVPNIYQRTTIVQSILRAIDGLDLKQQDSSFGHYLYSISWSDFDNTLTGVTLNELKDIPNTGDRLLAISTGTSFPK